MSVIPNIVVDQIRAQRGLDPLPDPTRILGFGNPEDEPPPDFSNPYPPLEEPMSPLIQAAQPQVFRAPELGHQTARELLNAPPQVSAAIPAPLPELVVVGPIGSFRGREVRLGEKDQAAIARIILEAVQRNLAETLAEVRAQAPRRIRTRAPKVVAAVTPIPNAANGEAPVKKKRGRPLGWRKPVASAPVGS